MFKINTHCNITGKINENSRLGHIAKVATAPVDLIVNAVALTVLKLMYASSMSAVLLKPNVSHKETKECKKAWVCFKRHFKYIALDIAKVLYYDTLVMPIFAGLIKNKDFLAPYYQELKTEFSKDYSKILLWLDGNTTDDFAADNFAAETKSNIEWIDEYFTEFTQLEGKAPENLDEQLVENLKKGILIGLSHGIISITNIIEQNALYQIFHLAKFAEEEKDNSFPEEYNRDAFIQSLKEGESLDTNSEELKGLQKKITREGSNKLDKLNGNQESLLYIHLAMENIRDTYFSNC